jgi:hypothetical protein
VTSLLNRRSRALEIIIVATVVPLFASYGDAQSTELPPYASTQQLTGVIRTWGSPQMGDLLKRYEDGFRKVQPSVHFEDALKSTVSAVAGVYSNGNAKQHGQTMLPNISRRRTNAHDGQHARSESLFYYLRTG